MLIRIYKIWKVLERGRFREYSSEEKGVYSGLSTSPWDLRRTSIL